MEFCTGQAIKILQANLEVYQYKEIAMLFE